MHTVMNGGGNLFPHSPQSYFRPRRQKPPRNTMEGKKVLYLDQAGSWMDDRDQGRHGSGTHQEDRMCHLHALRNVYAISFSTRRKGKRGGESSDKTRGKEDLPAETEG